MKSVTLSSKFPTNKKTIYEELMCQLLRKCTPVYVNFNYKNYCFESDPYMACVFLEIVVMLYLIKVNHTFLKNNEFFKFYC